MGELYKQVKIQGTKSSKKLKALIDSGATTSLIDKHLADIIGMPDYGGISGESIDGRAVHGIKSSALVLIGGSRGISTDFIVLDRLPEKIILGADFLQNHDIIINYAKEKATIPPIYKKKRFRL